MPQPPPYPDPGDGREAAPERGRRGGSPRRLPVLGIVLGLALLVLVVVLHLSGVIGPGIR